MVDFELPEQHDVESLARFFRYFGEVETPRLDAPVYTAYSLGVAEDPELLALAARVQPSQPAPNVLYAAVQDLLLEDADRSESARALARFYPAITGAPIPDASPWPAFRRFCLEHAEELVPLLEHGRTQTCVVHRSAVLLPALGSLPRVRAAGGRLAALEIGPSAGLNLRLDRYRYRYVRHDEDGSAAESAARLEWGAPGATPLLECELRGATAPPLPDRLELVARHGLELAPIDLEDPRGLRWLRALIWPEHRARARVMDEALAVAAAIPASIVQGDATRDVEVAIGALPGDAPRVLFATQALYQIPASGLEAMYAGIARVSREAPIDLVSMESDGRGASRVEWRAFEAGRADEPRVLARADSHGRWIEWGGGR
jgi:hypothetical protein